MGEKRDNIRHHKRLKVRYGDNDHMNTAFTGDVSEGGIFIRSGSTRPPKSILKIELETAENEKVTLSGEVCWTRRIPANMVHKLKGGMGVRITDFVSGEEAFRKLMEFLKKSR